MKTQILVQLVYCVLFARGNGNSVDKILDYKFEKEIDGPYTFKFATSHGHQREEIAELLHEGTEFESILLRGSYQYLGADGKTYTVKYRADDNGFHPEGEHFEVPPFVPWPSKIDLRYTKEELKDSGSIANPSKAFSLNPIKFLTTQRPPKFVYTPIESSTVPSRYFTSTKQPKRNGALRGRQSKSFKGVSPKNKLMIIPQEYIPTSTRKPLTKGDVVGSSTARNPKFTSIPIITREYIPTSSSPPTVKGDIVGSSQILDYTKNSSNQRRTMSKYPFRTGLKPSSPTSGSTNNILPRNEIHPTITYEGRPSDGSSSFEDSISISIPENRIFGSRTKARKIVSNFVTTEYPSIRVRTKTLSN